jgi:hypothetical protein
MTIVCEICDKVFSSYRQLNGHKSIHRLGGRYTVSRKKNKQSNFCLNCNYETHNTKFCKISCQHEYNKKISHSKILKEKKSSFFKLKQYIIETKGYKCELCNIGSTWNKLPLTLHCDHIDGDSDNNTLDNLRIVCPNCHSQTDTWCGRNKKNTERNNYLRKYKKKVP